MTHTARLAAILRAENDALARHDVEAALALLPAKQAAAAALAEALPGAPPNLEAARQLRALTQENAARLEAAMAIQSRILEMVARAARAASPGAQAYGTRGRPMPPIAALALAMRA